MTPSPSNPLFSSAFRHDAAGPSEILAYPVNIQEYLLPLKKRATTPTTPTSHGSDRGSGDDSFSILPEKKRRADDGGEGIPAQTRPRRMASINAAYVSMEEDEAWTSAGVTKKNRHGSSNAGDRKKRPRVARDAAPVVQRPLRLSEAQQGQLKKLGATAPRFVCMKTLQKSDVDRNQNRLLFSCKTDYREGHPITGILAQDETYLVRKYEHGLQVTAVDDQGREFTIKLKYLDSNGAYRIIGGWNDFVSKNGLEKPVKNGDLQVDVELWEFRSHSLPVQPDKAAVLDGANGHPDGALGFLVQVHREEGSRERAPRPVQKTKRQAPAKAVRTKKLEHVGGGQDVVLGMTLDEIVKVVGEEMAGPLVGLLMLKSSVPVPVPPFENTSSVQAC